VNGNHTNDAAAMQTIVERYSPRVALSMLASATAYAVQFVDGYADDPYAKRIIALADELDEEAGVGNETTP
jgi:hypothetical protein